MKAHEFDRLIAECCGEVLDAMYFTSVIGVESPETMPADPPRALLSFSLHFAGEIAGRFGVWLEPSTARSLAANFLGEEETNISSNDASEVVGELANMFCGSVMSRAEREQTFVLSHPEPIRLPPFCDTDDSSVCRLATDSGTITVWIAVEGDSCHP